MLHEIPFANDGNLTYELLIERYNSDLANILGNLVNRTISMAHKYFDGIVPTANELNDDDKELIDSVLKASELVSNSMDNLKIADAIDNVFEIFRKSNKYIDVTTPWTLAKEGNTERLKTVIYNLLESIRIGAVLLKSFLPETADKIFEQLNTNISEYDSVLTFGNLKAGEKLNEASALFARLDKEAKLKEIEEKFEM